MVLLRLTDKACNSEAQLEVQATPPRRPLDLPLDLPWNLPHAETLHPADRILALTSLPAVAAKSASLAPGDMKTTAQSRDSAAADTPAVSAEAMTSRQEGRRLKAWRIRGRSLVPHEEMTGEAVMTELLERVAATGAEAENPCPNPKARSALERLRARLLVNQRPDGSEDLVVTLSPWMAGAAAEGESIVEVVMLVAEGVRTREVEEAEADRAKISWGRSTLWMAVSAGTTKVRDLGLVLLTARRGGGAGGRRARFLLRGCIWKAGELSCNDGEARKV